MRKLITSMAFIFVFISLISTPCLAKSKKVIYYDFDNCKKITKQPFCECSIDGVQCIDGVKNRALAFLGKGDFIKESRAPQGSFSISFWIRTVERGSAGQGDGVAGCTGLVDAKTWGVALCGNKIGFGLGKTTIMSKTDVTTGRWHFVVTTLDASSGELKLYINGKLEAEAKVDFHQEDTSPASYIYIGASQSAQKTYFYGSLDELKIYSRVLNAEEIIDMYDKLNPYKVRVVQITTIKTDYKEIEYEREVEVERRPRPTPR